MLLGGSVGGLQRRRGVAGGQSSSNTATCNRQRQETALPSPMIALASLLFFISRKKTHLYASFRRGWRLGRRLEGGRVLSIQASWYTHGNYPNFNPTSLLGPLEKERGGRLLLPSYSTGRHAWARQEFPIPRAFCFFRRSL